MRRTTPFRLAFAAGVLCGMALAIISGAGLGVRLLDHGADAAQPDVTVNAAGRHQVIDGWGVNANPKNWGNASYPPLQPGIDLLIDDLGAKIWRVDVYGKSNWEATNDDADPFTFNWTYYNQLYETAPFQALWSTLAELNAKGISPIISASGVVPDWMGGSSINNDDEFVETFVSLVYYARMVKNVTFTLVDPLNETDLGQPEGPSVSASHMATILSKMAARLQALLPDVRLVAPETSSPNTTYNGALLGDSGVAPYMQVYAGHHYSPFDMGPEAQQLQSAGNTTARLWMTEYSTSIFGFLDNGQTVPDEWAFTSQMATNLFGYVRTGAQAALVWDAYDNVHDHAASYTRWGLLDTLNNYAPKKRYYGTKQVFGYVKSGSVRVDITTSVPNMDLLAFVDDATGSVTIVGQNTGSARTLTLAMQGMTAPASLSLTQTTSTLDNAPGGTFSLSAGTYSIPVAANGIFTLTSAGASGTGTPTATSTGTVAPSPTSTRTATPTVTTSPTPGSTSTATSTAIATTTATATVAPSQTAGVTSTTTPTSSPTRTSTVTNTPSVTATATSTPTAAAGATATFGITTSGGADDTSDSGHMNGSPFSLSSPGTLTWLSVYIGSTPANAHVRLALYSMSTSGIPSALLAQTGEAIATAGWNTLPVTGGPALPVGTYWIVAQTDNGSTVYRIQGGLTTNDAEGWSTFAYGAFPPNAGSGWTVVTRQAFDMYGTVLISSGTSTPTLTSTSTPAPTVTLTPTSTATSTVTRTATSTPTATASATATATASATATPTAVPTATNSPTPTNTAAPTATPTFTPTNTSVPTATNSPTPTLTALPTATFTATATRTATGTPVPSSTNTALPSPTSTTTAAPTATSTRTATVAATATPTPTVPPAPTPTNTSATTVNFGITTSGGANDSSDYGYMNASRYTLSRSGRLVSLSVFIGSTPSGAHVKLALYSDTSAGAPGALLAETGPGNATAGWLQLSVAGGPVLAPGRYWIVAQTDNRATVYRLQGGLTSSDFEAWAPLSYGAFPSNGPAAWTKVSRQSFDMYATIVP